MPKSSLEAEFGRMTKEKRKEILSFFREHGIVFKYKDRDGTFKDGYSAVEEMDKER